MILLFLILCFFFPFMGLRGLGLRGLGLRILRLRVLSFFCCGLSISSIIVHAKREASVGGELNISLRKQQKYDFIQQHTRISILHKNYGRSLKQELAKPALKSFPDYYSSVISDLKSKNTTKTWLIKPQFISLKRLDDALTKCFSARYQKQSFVAGILKSAHIKIVHQRLAVRNKPKEQWLKLQFSEPFALFPEFLSHCFLEQTHLGAAYLLKDQNLYRQKIALEGPAFLEVIHLQISGAPKDVFQGSIKSDLVVDGEEHLSGSTLYSFYPEMIYMLPSHQMILDDPLNFNSPENSSLSYFHQELQAQMIADLYAPGRAQAAFHILPPGISPTLRGDIPLSNTPLQSLRLQNLDEDAHQIKVVFDATDILLKAVFERFVVLFQSRGIRLVRSYAQNLSSGEAFFTLLRWRSPSSHPVLAVASLLQTLEKQSMQQDFSLHDLLTLNRERQLERSLELEQDLLKQRTIIPLMQVHHYYLLPPNLKGVRLLPNNILDLSNAHWEGMQ